MMSTAEDLAIAAVKIRDLRDRLTTSLSVVAGKRKVADRISSRFMTARVLSFLGVASGFFMTVATQSDLYSWLLMFPSLALFFLFVRLHQPSRREILRLTALDRLITEKCQRIDSEKRATLDDASVLEPEMALLKPENLDRVAEFDFVLDDLAVFAGNARLFSIIDVAQTRLGSLQLATWLRNPCEDVEEIRSRQTAARELLSQITFREKLEQSLFAAIAAPSDESIAFLRESDFAPPGAKDWRLSVVFAALVIGTVVTAVMVKSALVCVLAFAIAGIGNMKFKEFLSAVPFMRQNLDLWRALLKSLHSLRQLFQVHQPKSAKLCALQTEIEAALDDPVLPVSRLERTMRWADCYKFGLLYVIFAWLTFFEIWLFGPLLKDLKSGREPLIKALRALGELEALTSLATLAEEQRGYDWPECVNGPPELAIENGIHPLLPFESAVANSIILEANHSIGIVTGSNMAGKSTFLKMCGLNQLLAQVGAPVRAKNMRCTPLRLRSDINVQDSLDDGRSYFAVEVARIKNVLEEVAAGAPVFAILDEMFRGTNTREKVAAGLEVVHWLANKGCLVLVATHDDQFTLLAAQDTKIDNYHFAETISEGKMEFDYKLELGPARSRNAIKVLELEGFPSEIVKRALERTKKHD